MQCEAADKAKDADGTVKVGEQGQEQSSGATQRLPYMGVSMPLGAHLFETTKEKIWKGEFVDVFKLLHRDIEA